MTEQIPTESLIPLAEPLMEAECVQAVARQIETTFVGPGATTQKFAAALATHAGVAHCVPTVSGTIALSVAAKALGLEAGDEILVPAYGVISTINAFASIGLKPRLVGIDRSTGCMDPQKLASTIGRATKAVCYVNFSGRTGPEIEQAAAVCSDAGRPLIEDAACALGQRHHGRAAGSFGTISIYSFSVPKVITTGQGGAVLTDRRELHDAAARWIDQGDLDWRRTNSNHGIGTNLRFNDVLAALGLAQLERLEQRLERRRAARAALRARLGSRLHAGAGDEAPLHNVVFTAEPDRLVDHLRARKILAVRQYRAIYQHPAYRELAAQTCDAAEFWTDHAVYLPFGVALRPEDADRIGRTVDDSGIRLLEAP